MTAFFTFSVFAKSAYRNAEYILELTVERERGMREGRRG